jgi:chemosensory pili system protein ChpC
MSAAAQELYSLLIPLWDERLIVPRTCVAEVISFIKPDPIDGAPEWLLGTVNWSGREVPLVSFEGACGRSVEEKTRRTRIVVFHALLGQLRPAFFAILSKGFPQLVRVNPDVLQPETSKGFSDKSPVLCQLRMINEYPLVPDIERLEEMILAEVAPPAD